MKNLENKASEVKVTLTAEGLKKYNTAQLQGICKRLNLSIGLKSVLFTRDQLKTNLEQYGRMMQEKELAEKGKVTREELEKFNDETLFAMVTGLGFNTTIDKTNRLAMIDAVLTYKGAGAVNPSPADRKKKDEAPSAAAVALAKVPDGIAFHYPTSKTQYKITERLENGNIKIANVETNKPWVLKSEKETTREVIVVA